MKKLVDVQEVNGEGLISLLGEPVLLFCSNYFYADKLVGVNAEYVLLENGGMVMVAVGGHRQDPDQWS